MSPRSKLAYKRIREDRRDGIITAARRVFAGKGFAGTKIEDIATAAGISKGLLYHYFESKEDLFTALVQQAMEGALKLIRDALRHPGTPSDRLYWLAAEVLVRAQREPDEFMIIIQAFTSEAVPKKTRAMAAKYTVTSTQTISELIEEGQATGQVVVGDPDQLAMTFTACLQGLALSATSHAHKATSLPDVNVVARMLATTESKSNHERSVATRR